MSLIPIQIQELSQYFRTGFFSKITSILLFTFFILCKIGVLPEAIVTVMGLLWILYVPFAIGALFLAIPIKWIRNLSNSVNSSLSHVLIKWFIGVFLIVSIVFPASINHLDIASIFGSILLLMAISLPFIHLRNTFAARIDKTVIRIVVISLILGIAFGGYVRSFSPYPLTPGFDTFAHMYEIKSVLNGSIDTSNVPYFPAFHIVVALGSATFNADVTEIFWTGSIVLFCLFAISIYTMAYWIARNHVYGFLASIIGLSITEMGFAPNLQVFFPASFVMSIFPVTFFVIDSIWRKNPPNLSKKFPIVLTLIVFSGLILIHYALGFVAALILLSYLVVSHCITKNESFLFIVRIATISMVGILLMYVWGYLAIQAIVSHNFGGKMVDYSYLYDASTKNGYLNQWYTKQIVTFSLLGLIALTLFKERKAVVLSFLASILLLVYFQQIEAIHRVMTLERSLLSFAAATLIALPISIILKRPHFLPPRHVSNIPILASHDSNARINLLAVLTPSRSITVTGIIYIMLVTMLMFPTIITPYDAYIAGYSLHNDAFVNFSSEELNVAKWIEKNTPVNYLVFSDPFTVIEMKGLAFRENIKGIGWNITVANLVKSVMTSQSAAEAYGKIVSNMGQKVMIIITPRTSEWVRNMHILNPNISPDSYFVNFPIQDFKAFNGFNKFFDKHYFNLEYRSNNIFVFTPNSNHANEFHGTH